VEAQSTLKSDEPLYDAIKRLADLMLPASISLQDVAKQFPYSKSKAVEQVVEAARQDPLLTKIRLHIIYTELRNLANNGGLL